MPSLELGRVLILENDYSNRILFTDYLEHCGYRVLPISNEQQLFENLERFHPDVLILNLRMPVVDGFTVIEQLRRDPRWQQLAILVVSGYTLASDRRKAQQVGANAYLTKPVLPSDLSATVAKLIG
jgi:two-component system, cell cycle response regulator DivK